MFRQTLDGVFEAIAADKGTLLFARITYAANDT